jgi:hypothetical protein
MPAAGGIGTAGRHKALLANPLAQMGYRRREGDHESTSELTSNMLAVVTETRSIDLACASIDQIGVS